MGTWAKKRSFDHYSKWLNYKSYLMGEHVTYMGHTYQSKTNHCVAEPTSKTHKIFYWLFSHPFQIVTLLLLLKIWCFIIMISLTYINRRWYTTVINIMELLLNSHSFFILCRDFFILYYSQNLNIKKRN